MRIKVAIVNREARLRDLTGVILVSKELDRYMLKTNKSDSVFAQ